MKIERILFDLDGTLFDTQVFHAEAESSLAQMHGVAINPLDLSMRYAGRPTEEVFMDLLGCDKEKGKKLALAKWEILHQRTGEARELCDLSALFTRLEECGVALSIGTASPVRWANELLQLNGLGHFFSSEAVIGGDMVERGKPSPDIWQRAACGTPPGCCLVVEDGIAGVAAAVSANMRSALLLPRTHAFAHPISSLWELFPLLQEKI